MKSIDECILSKKIEDFRKETIESQVGIKRIKTGFDAIDDVLGGGLAPGLTVLGAASGLGKSTFILQLAENVSSQGIPVLFFSLEMMSNMIAAKAINRELFIRSKKDIDRKYSALDLTNSEIVQQLTSSKSTWKSIEESRKNTEERSKNLYVLDYEKLNEDELTAKGIYEIVKSFVNDKTDRANPLVIVDYLQILRSDPTDNRGDRQSIEYCIRLMKKICNELKLSVILISSLSRASYKQKVQQDSFKETGGIEYSSDVLLGLSFCNAPSEKSDKNHKFDIDEEKAKVPRAVELSFLKQRYGVSGMDSVVKMNYYAKYDFFEEVSIGDSKNNSSKTKSKNYISKVAKRQNTSENSSKEEETKVRERNIGSGNYPQGETIV